MSRQNLQRRTSALEDEARRANVPKMWLEDELVYFGCEKRVLKLPTEKHYDYLRKHPDFNFDLWRHRRSGRLRPIPRSVDESKLPPGGAAWL